MSKLYVFMGLQGSGKSTVSKMLADALNLPVFSVDPIESAIITAGIEKSFETGYAAYLVAQQMAKENIGHSNVVIDAANYTDEARNVWISLARETSSNMVLIECICSDEDLHKKRIEQRVRNLPGFEEITWEDVMRRKKETEEWAGSKIVIDTAEEITVGSLVRQVTK